MCSLQVKAAVLEAVAEDSPQHGICPTPCGAESQVSGPTHLDLRVNPNGAFIREQTLLMVEHVKGVWPGRPVALSSQDSWCSGAGPQDGISVEDHGCPNYPELPFA